MNLKVLQSSNSALKLYSQYSNYLLCPERDSNPHDLKVTAPSRLHVYQFHHLGRNKKRPARSRPFDFCDLAGVRTQDPLLKREMLYQLSYQVLCVYSGANIGALFVPASPWLKFLLFN
jgi:hypothetical protein